MTKSVDQFMVAIAADRAAEVLNALRDTTGLKNDLFYVVVTKGIDRSIVIGGFAATSTNLPNKTEIGAVGSNDFYPSPSVAKSGAVFGVGVAANRTSVGGVTAFGTSSLGVNYFILVAKCIYDFLFYKYFATYVTVRTFG